MLIHPPKLNLARNKSTYYLIFMMAIMSTLLFYPQQGRAGNGNHDGNPCTEIASGDEQLVLEPLRIAIAGPESVWSPSVSVQELSIKVPRRARKAFKKGVRALRDSRPDEASRQFQAALEIEPRYFRAMTALAVVSFNRGELDLSRRYAEQAIDIDSQYLPALEVLGAADVLSGSYSKAVEELSEVVQLRPRARAAHHYLGLALLHLDECEEARKHLEIAANLSDYQPRQKHPIGRSPKPAAPFPTSWPRLPHPF